MLVVEYVSNYRIAGNDCGDFNFADCIFFWNFAKISSAIFLSTSQVSVENHVVAALFLPTTSLPAFLPSLTPKAFCEANKRVAGLATEAKEAGLAPKWPKTSHYNYSAEDSAICP